MPKISVNKFSLTPLGLFIDDDIYRDDKAVFRENVNAIVAFGKTTEIHAYYTEQLHVNRMIIGIALNDKLYISENLGGKIVLSVSLNDKLVVQENITGLYALGSIHSMKGEFKEELRGIISLGSETKIGAIFGELVGGSLDLGSETINSASYAENIGAIINIFHITTEIMEIDVVIPPDGTIMINTADYTATLNNEENIIHLISGDWARLTRDTIHIEIEGGVVGNIVYTTRWL